MDKRTNQFINAVRKEIQWDRMNEKVDGSLTCDALNIQRGWEELEPFLQWAETEAPSWTEVEASIGDMESPTVCDALGNQTLTRIAEGVCKTYISNAFSLGMIPQNLLGKVRLCPSSEEEAYADTAAVSIVGHADTAAVLGVDYNRESVTLEAGDVLYVAQLQGGRLPEGCKTLPEGFRFEWVKVELFTLYQ